MFYGDSHRCVKCAVFVDMCRYKIPNLCIVVGMIAGLIMTYTSYSFAGVGKALAQAGLVFLVLYPFYLMRGLGAGDVKLFIMTACFFAGKAATGLSAYKYADSRGGIDF